MNIKMINKIAQKLYEHEHGERTIKECKQYVIITLNVLKNPGKKFSNGVMQASLDCTPINRCEQQALQIWQNTIQAMIDE